MFWFCYAFLQRCTDGVGGMVWNRDRKVSVRALLAQYLVRLTKFGAVWGPRQDLVGIKRRRRWERGGDNASRGGVSRRSMSGSL